MTLPTPAGYHISTDPSRIDVDRLHLWLSGHAYWARGRSLDVVQRSVAGAG